MIQLSIELTGDIPKLAKRKFKQILKASWHKAGEKDFQRVTGQHFTKGGARKYKYAPRSPGYVKAKKRRWGHTIPLVWSGQSRALAKIMNVKATSRGVTEPIRAPGLNRTPKGGRINMRDEVTRRTRGDIARVETWMHDQIRRRTEKLK